MKLHFSVDKTIVRAFFVMLCRLLTGVKAFWRTLPQPDRATIYYANHSSHLDGLVIWASFPRALRNSVHPVAAADYWNKTALRRYLATRIFNAILVERSSPASAAKETVKQRDPLQPLMEKLEQGHSLIFFPEGTRGFGDEVASFKSGLYHLTQRLPAVQLIPVWLENMNRVLPKGSRLVVPIICTATFGEPLPAVTDDETKKEFLDRARCALEALAHD
ncbi:lysophospholipid acyltransferase family protein [Kosakonia sp.]|uniref:lysophospholipid acyltransferase family protein n=1 Tax=Kosakonia sp. TaxID=1916651 RepID=UPI0028AAE627|nr:lysophospholipid acyltransferase family protein [Kosakonia sp.]